MFIGSDDNLNKTRNLSQIHIDGHTLKSVECTKCLDVYISMKDLLGMNTLIIYIKKYLTSICRSKTSTSTCFYRGVITQQGYDVRSYVIREELGWKTLQETRDKHKVVLIYKTLNNLQHLHICQNTYTCPIIWRVITSEITK